MQIIDNESFMEYNDYLRRMNRIDPNFGIRNCFRIAEKEREEFVMLMEEIEKINIQIKKTSDRKEKNKLNRKKGKMLEELAKSIMDTSSIFSIKTNIRDHTNEIDLLLTPANYSMLHSELLPIYLKEDVLIECKNYKDTIKNDWIGKFFSLLKTHKAKLGIIFSYKEFAGRNEWDAAKGLVRKLFLAEDVYIINIDFNDIKTHIIEEKMNLVELIISKYEGIKNSVSYKEFISKHPAEKN